MFSQQSKLKFRYVRRSWEQEQYLPSIPPSPSCLSVCLGLSDLTRGPHGLRSPFEGGNVSCGCLAVWLGLWGPAAWELHSASSARHWASLCPRSRRRLRQQIAVKSQRRSPAPQPSRISMRGTAAPSVRWDVPNQDRASRLLSPTLVIHWFARTREELRAEVGAEATVGSLLTVTMGIPCGFISSSVFHNKSGIKKTDGHGYTWVWSYSFTLLSDLLMFSVVVFFSSVLIRPWFKCRSRDSFSSSGSWLVRGGVFFCVRRLVCVSLFGFVSMNALLILSAKKNSFDQFYSHSHPSSFFHWHWHSQIRANGVKALRGSSVCHTIYLNNFTLQKEVRLNWRSWAVLGWIHGTHAGKYPNVQKPGLGIVWIFIY